MHPSVPTVEPWRNAHPLNIAPVPNKYRGVWMRTLIETPQLRDTRTCVRWMQLSRWHGDLRIPVHARPSQTNPVVLNADAVLKLQEGFCGITQVSQGQSEEICTWHRLVDYQPSQPAPDTGTMVFHDADTIEEKGIHSVYREIWQRLPDSTGRAIAVVEPALPNGQMSACWLIAGIYAMRVRPAAHAASTVEISFGSIDSGQWRVEHSTWPELEGQRIAFVLNRERDDIAILQTDHITLPCKVLEWSE